MVKTYKDKNQNLIYPKALKDVLLYGQSMTTRGMKVKEISPVIVEIEKPRERFLTTLGRGGNPFFLCAEIVWILAGLGSVEWLAHYNSKMRLYADKGYSEFNASYGNRLMKHGFGAGRIEYSKLFINQINEVVKKLKKDKYTRQAVICLWDVKLDNLPNSKDYPCNNMLYFKYRDDKLTLRVITRSSDVNLGLFMTNIFQFSVVHEVIAGMLGMELGKLLYYSDSLHVYEDSQITNKVLIANKDNDDKYFNLYDYVSPSKFDVSMESHYGIINHICGIEQLYRIGQFDWNGDVPSVFWSDVLLMIKIWNLRKHDKHKLAIYETGKIKSDDIKIVALEYQYRNTKNNDIKELILSLAEDYHNNVKKYIKHGDVQNGRNKN